MSSGGRYGRGIAVVIAVVAGISIGQFQGAWAQEAPGTVAPVATPAAAVTPVSEATPVAQGTPAVAPVLEVRFAEGKVSVTALEAELGAALKKIAEAAGIEIEVGPGVEGTVTTAFTDEPLEKAIERVLEVAGAKNFAAQYDMEQATARLRKVVVLERGGQEAHFRLASQRAKNDPRSQRPLEEEIGRGMGCSVGPSPK